MQDFMVVMRKVEYARVSTPCSARVFAGNGVIASKETRKDGSGFGWDTTDYWRLLPIRGLGSDMSSC